MIPSNSEFGDTRNFAPKFPNLKNSSNSSAAYFLTKQHSFDANGFPDINLGDTRVTEHAASVVAGAGASWSGWIVVLTVTCRRHRGRVATDG